MTNNVRFAFIATLIALVAANGWAASKSKDKIWTDPVKAAADDPAFELQGEYTGKNLGVQVVALGQGRFHVAHYPGGLPGAGWDKTGSKAVLADVDELKTIIAGLKKVKRTSPTIGQKPPEGAIVLFDGKPTEHLKEPIKDGLLWAGGRTQTSFGNFKLHLEFRTPYRPTGSFGGQDRGNSGIYILDRYEIQILDSFGLDFNIDNLAQKPRSANKQWCGCFYKFKLADVNMCLPPLTWQTYDIDFTAPKFKDGEKVANARVTLVHNGVTVHDDVELPKGTGAGAKRKEVPEGPINFQGHGNPVAFRNVWLVEKK